MSEQPVLLTDVRSCVGTLTLNRPGRRNALSPELLLKIHETLSAWAQSDEVRCVVITGGSCSAFSSGYDLASLPTEMTPELADIMKNGNPLEFALNTVAAYPYPVIAMMNGYAFGAGLNLCMCCDMRIAVQDVRVGMPPVKLGLVYHPEGLRQFIEVLGMARTRELFFTGKTYQGAEVLEMGLVNRLVPELELAAFTYAMAGEMAQNAPLALKGAKRIMAMFSRGMQLTEANMRQAEELIAEAFDSDDIKEGQAAFFEKRKPRFTGT